MKRKKSRAQSSNRSAGKKRGPIPPGLSVEAAFRNCLDKPRDPSRHDITLDHEPDEYMPLGGTRASCSCGWWSDRYSQFSDTERAIAVHLRRELARSLDVDLRKELAPWAAENATTFADFRATAEEWREMLDGGVVRAGRQQHFLVNADAPSPKDAR